MAVRSQRITAERERESCNMSYDIGVHQVVRGSPEINYDASVRPIGSVKSITRLLEG